MRNLQSLTTSIFLPLFLISHVDGLFSTLTYSSILLQDKPGTYTDQQKRTSCTTPRKAAVQRGGMDPLINSSTTSLHSLTERPIHRISFPYSLKPYPDANLDDSKKTTTALIILNSPIHDPSTNPVFTSLWNISTFRVCADGGANRLYDATVSKAVHSDGDPQKVTDTDSNNFVPDLIRGDLDSLQPHVRSFYESKGCRVECDPDQDSNDLDKALKSIFQRMKSDACRDQFENVLVYVYGAFGGRFDQEMASIQALYKWAEEFQYNIFLYNSETCAMLLPPSHRNEVILEVNWKNNNAKIEGNACGLIPIGSRCDSARTSGLKWNLDGQSLEFGGLVSTSNRMIEDTITVHASHQLIFTAEINEDFYL